MNSLAKTPAFPHFVPVVLADETDDIKPMPGMTMRHYYAGLAMQSLASIAGPDGMKSYPPATAASYAVNYADALIAELGS